jgi:hypothetical protein
MRWRRWELWIGIIWADYQLLDSQIQEDPVIINVFINAFAEVVIAPSAYPIETAVATSEVVSRRGELSK